MAAKAAVEGIVLLDRRERAKPGIERISAEEAIDVLFRGGPSYGARVNALHEQTIRKLTAAQAYRLHYDALEDALRLLDGIS